LRKAGETRQADQFLTDADADRFQRVERGALGHRLHRQAATIAAGEGGGGRGVELVEDLCRRGGICLLGRRLRPRLSKWI
jgi:hypothetical protein